MKIKKSNLKEFETGAHKKIEEGKGRYDLLSPRALHRVAQRFEYGALRYGDKDWNVGIPFSVLLDSGLRHIFQFAKGEDSEDHLAAAVTNFLMIMEYEELIKEGKINKDLGNLK